MASEITVPRLGWSMEQGVFMGWLKKDGDAVRAGEPLFMLESDKAVQEIEALDDGILRIAANGPEEGDAVAVGAVLGHVEAYGEAASGDESAYRVTKAEAQRAEPPASRPQPTVVLRPSTPRPGRRAISPRARRAARQRGIDPAQLQGTGRGGRIRERDIVDLTLRVRPTSTDSATLTITADATNLVNLRAQFKALAKRVNVPVPTYTDLFLKLAVIALEDHPRLHASWSTPGAEASLEIHIGFGVDAGAGLLLPVLCNANRLTLRQLALQTRALAEKARLRQLRPEDLQGGTFAVVNLGGYGIDAFTPIIDGPCATLGVGRIRKQAAVIHDQIVPRDLVTLNLAFDPRSVDEAAAARFLEALVKGIENPVAWLFL